MFCFTLSTEVTKVSPKELLYMEDALGRIQFLRQKCNQYQSQVTNEQLKGLLTRIENEQCTLFNQIYGQL